MGARVTVMIAEPEYETERTLPAFCAAHLANDYEVQIIHAAEDGFTFPGLAEALGNTDLLIVSVRRCALTKAQMRALRGYIAGGGPVLGIRTANHAFSLRGKAAPDGRATWESWDADVMGGSYTGHHGAQLATVAQRVSQHAISEGVPDAAFSTGGSLYKVLPLEERCHVLLQGRADGIAEAQPVAWTYERADGGTTFYTSLGHPADFDDPVFNKMLRQVVPWLLGAAARNRAAPPLDPQGALDALEVADDLAVDLVLAEPDISQPVHLSFDGRGRLWVVEYRQYPDPAGLTRTGRDSIWRVTYDQTPPPPPHAADSPFRGKDRITIHEDSDGDGSYETHRRFLDGLNLATSIAHDARGGIWVTQPPYLLYYADINGDDMPDGDPEVHLAGFGIEDSHATANSLMWGPDGWLYGAQGSTCSAAIVRVGIDEPEDAVKSAGQMIWRYHPERRIYEVFAEGGGNTYGVNFDSKGNLFSGHNGGDTRGFHYEQGGYYRKNFGKHGALSNVYAFGHFAAMEHAKVERFTHQFVIYENDALPEKYRGKLWGVDIMHNNLVVSSILSDGSTFRTVDESRPVKTASKWFRPVHIVEGPEGDLFVADWCDRQVNHYRNHEGQIDHVRGRVFRIRAKQPQAREPRSPSELETFLARYRAGDFDADAALASENTNIQRWAVRLLGDEREVSDEQAEMLAALAANATDPTLLVQLAATARRLPAEVGLPMVKALSQHGLDDRHLPLMVWWAIEQHCKGSINEVMAMTGDEDWVATEIAREIVLPRLMKRCAMEGTEADFLRCADLLEIEGVGLYDDFWEAFSGRSMTTLPPRLVRLLEEKGGVGNQLEFGIRRGDEEIIQRALLMISAGEETHLVRVLGEVPHPLALPVLLELSEAHEGRGGEAALKSLKSYDDPRIAETLLAQLPRYDRVSRDLALNVLASRPDSALRMLERVPLDDIPPAEFFILRSHQNPRIDTFLDGRGEETPENADISRLTGVLSTGTGRVKLGEAIYQQRCMACHELHDKGGDIGPGLTSYQRQDLDSLLLAIIAPSAEIREGYQTVIAHHVDGSVHQGFLLRQDDAQVVLNVLGGAEKAWPRGEIRELKVVPTSLMPSGLIDDLDDQALRDLIAYLQTTTPPL